MFDIIEPVPSTLTAATPTVLIDPGTALVIVNVLAGAGTVVLVSEPVTLRYII